MQVAVGFSIYLTTINFAKESSSENIFKSVQIWRNYGHESVAPLFLAHPVFITPPPNGGAEYCGERVRLSVCMCLSVRDHIFGTTRPIFTIFLRTLHVSVARSATGGVLIRYVFLVLLSSFIPGLKPSFSADPSHRSLPFLLQNWLHGFPGLFTDISEHIRFLLFSVSFLHFLVVRSVR